MARTCIGLHSNFVRESESMFEIREVSADGWNAQDLPAFNDHAESVRAIVLGAGLSKAANPKSPIWSGLIEEIARRNPHVAVVERDPISMATKLSRELSLPHRTALATPFQKTITDILEESNGGSKGIDRKLSEQLKRVIERTRCDVIIDLNYDDVAEKILLQEQLSYYRVVGSQLDVVAPLPLERHLVLWKIHGSIDKPSTIVAALDEYERIYHTNALKEALEKLGSKLMQLVTVGVGLTCDDKLWPALLSERLGIPEPLEIIALWLSEAWEGARAEEALSGWRAAVQVARCTVLSAPCPDSDPASSLANRLSDFAEMLDDVPHRKTDLWVKQSAKDRWKAFDEDYEEALGSGANSEKDVARVMREYGRDYQNLLHSVLTWTSNGPGRRSLASLGEDALNGRSDGNLSGDLAAILDKMEELYRDHVKGGTNLLVACCAQEILCKVLDLVQIMEVGSITLPQPPSGELEVKRNTWTLVGLNPFQVQNLVRYNLLHRFPTKVALPIRYPLWGSPDDKGEPRDSKGGGESLQKEDEWEARVARLYQAGNPAVCLGNRKIRLGWAPPVFPWGFHGGGLSSYRRTKSGTVSQVWHLVEETKKSEEAGEGQICKGGSLRDTDIESFKIAFRGLVRLGEFDDFVQTAPA